MKEALVGGWQVNGIYTWQRGFPLTVTAADLGGLNDTFGTNRADLVGDPNTGGHSIRAVVQHRRLRAARRRSVRQRRDATSCADPA